MAIYYTDNSKKCSKEDGIYVYIMYPNKELKKITISIELGYSKRFKNKDDMYEKCIRNIENFYDSFIEDDEIIDAINENVHNIIESDDYLEAFPEAKISEKNITNCFKKIKLDRGKIKVYS